VLLALDSSTLTLSLALLQRTPDGALELVSEVSHGPPRRLSELLPGAVAQFLAQNGVALREVEAVAVGLGPGSFTGLRVGLATAKGLAYAMKWSLGGASSLAAIAMEGPGGRLLIPTAVARRGQLYAAKYRREGEQVRAIEPEREMTPAQLAAMLMEGEDSLALGPGIQAYQKELLAHGVPLERLSASPAFPSAAAVARLTRFPAAYEAAALFSLEPHYVRPSAAEENPAFPPLPGPLPAARIRED
jgi:tRNA threonylcarbamoyladenosine biosynthesis protein TsaB